MDVAILLLLVFFMEWHQNGI